MTFILDCVYIIVGACLLPYWLWKLPQGRRYRAGLLNRLGFSPRMPDGGRRLWIHCASVGEAFIPRTLVGEIGRRYPDWQVVFSTNTDTGAERLRGLYPGCPVFYMPLDISGCVRRAMRRIRPAAVLLVELEIWPVFLEECRRGGVPVGIINGRIGTSSRRTLRALSRLLPHMWDAVRVCCARSRDDAEGFVRARLPAERVFNCGSLKYDVLSPQPDLDHQKRLQELFGLRPDAPVLVAGSTHDGEEAILVAAYRDLRARHPELKLILAPRHVERAAEVTAFLRAQGFAVARKSLLDAGEQTAAGSEIILVDTIGDLLACYGLATCAFVGRSLVPPGGGQNMMEPAGLGKPVLVGPFTSNFKPEMRLLMNNGAVLVVRDAVQLAGEVDLLLSDPHRAERLGRAAHRVIAANRGATERTLERLRPFLVQAA